MFHIHIYIYINIRLKCTRKQPKNHSGPQQRNEYKRKLNMQNEQREREIERGREGATGSKQSERRYTNKQQRNAKKSRNVNPAPKSVFHLCKCIFFSTEGRRRLCLRTVGGRGSCRIIILIVISRLQGVTCKSTCWDSFSIGPNWIMEYDVKLFFSDFSNS